MNLYSLDKHGNIVEYAYDVFGNRTERKVSGKNPVTERFSYAGSNIFEIKTGERVEKYISGQNIDEIYGKIESDGNEEYYIRDYLGNIKAVFDKDGIMKDYRRYRAYGVEEKEPVSGFGFTSREYDDITGLYYYRSRYYDPTIGRFLQKDKYNEAGLLNNDPSVVYNPSQLNNYAYVANNPVNYVDPRGTDVIVFNDSDFGLDFFKLFKPNFGHNAIAIEIHNKKNEWHMYSFSGKGSLNQVFSSEKALYDIFLKENEGDYDRFIKIKTNIIQDMSMINVADLLIDNHYNPYYPFNFHCGDFVDNVLESGGFSVGESKKHYWPNDKFEGLLNAQNCK